MKYLGGVLLVLSGYAMAGEVARAFKILCQVNLNIQHAI
jgi:hypothetical protein